MIDALAYFSYQYAHENDPIFMEKLANLSPAKIQRQFDAIISGNETKWDTKWNNDVFQLNAIFGDK